MVNEIEDDQVEEEPKNLRARQKALKYFNLEETVEFYVKMNFLSGLKVI